MTKNDYAEYELNCIVLVTDAINKSDIDDSSKSLRLEFLKYASEFLTEYENPLDVHTIILQLVCKEHLNGYKHPFTLEKTINYIEKCLVEENHKLEMRNERLERQIAVNASALITDREHKLIRNAEVNKELLNYYLKKCKDRLLATRFAKSIFGK